MAIPAIDFIFWVTQCLAMALAALLIPKLRVTSIFGPVLAVVALGFINTTVWSSQLFFSLPDHISIHTLILLAINGTIFWVVVKIMPGIETDGILPSLIAPIVFTLCALAIPRVAERVDWDAVRNRAAQSVGQVKGYVESPASDPSSSQSNE